MKESQVTWKELQDTIKRGKAGKANGPDRILLEYIKYATENVIATLLDLINTTGDNAIYPTERFINYLTAIYKSTKDDPDNYRELVIGSAIKKILQRLERVINEKNILSPNQIEFRKGFWAADHIYVQPRYQGNVFAASRSPIHQRFSEREGPGIEVAQHHTFYKKLNPITSNLGLNRDAHSAL